MGVGLRGLAPIFFNPFKNITIMDYIFKNIKLFVVMAILALITFFSIKSCSEKKDKVNDLQHNIHVLNSEVETYKTANGELAYERDIYLSSVKGLRDVNDSLYAEIQNLKRYIDNAVTTEIIIHDTLHSEQTVYITQDLDTSFSFTFDDSWLRANHNLTLHNSTLKSESFEYTMSMNVGVYFSEDNTVILKSDNPHVVFSNVFGFSEQNKSPLSHHWGLGVQLGFGAVYFDKAVRLSPYIGAGISYNFLTF